MFLLILLSKSEESMHLSVRPLQHEWALARCYTKGVEHSFFSEGYTSVVQLQLQNLDKKLPPQTQSRQIFAKEEQLSPVRSGGFTIRLILPKILQKDLEVVWSLARAVIQQNKCSPPNTYGELRNKGSIGCRSCREWHNIPGAEVFHDTDVSNLSNICDSLYLNF